MFIIVSLCYLVPVGTALLALVALGKIVRRIYKSFR